MRVSIAAAFIVIAGLGAAYAAFVEHIDDRGFIIDIGGHIYEPAGYINQALNRLLRDCSEVENIHPGSRQWQAVTAYLRTHLQAGEPRLIVLMKAQSWLIAESEFSEAEPGVFLLRAQVGGYETQTVWGGTNAPFRTPIAIREYFRSEVPAVSAALVKCYEPVTPPFDS